jgi:DNA-binding response OmpR family regulator
LICEDDPDVALLLELMLRQYGYVTDTAGDAGHAKALLAQHRYAVLSLDLMLPDQNGISLIRELRATEATRDLPIVVVSATAEQGRQELNGHAFWVADWLSKPIDPNALVRAITHAVHPERGGKPRVLHVEGDADVLQVVTAILADTADVTQARDLAQARQLLDGGVFDLVILDPCLPDGSGAELLPLLQTERPQIPVVLFSEGEQDPAIFHQVNSVLVKSRTSNAQLVETITNLAKVRSGTLGNSRNNDE